MVVKQYHFSNSFFKGTRFMDFIYLACLTSCPIDLYKKCENIVSVIYLKKSPPKTNQTKPNNKPQFSWILYNKGKSCTWCQVLMSWIFFYWWNTLKKNIDNKLNHSFRWKYWNKFSIFNKKHIYFLESSLRREFLETGFFFKPGSPSESFKQINFLSSKNILANCF